MYGTQKALNIILEVILMKKAECLYFVISTYIKIIVAIKAVQYWQKQMHKSMEQNWKPRNNLMHTWSKKILQSQKYTMVRK